MAVGMRDQARFLSGDEIKQPPKMLVGATASPFVKPMEADVKKTLDKIAAGADFLQTQPVFDLATFSRWLIEVRRGASREVPILVGVLILRSPDQAERLAKVPGLAIGPEVLDRLKKATDAEAEGIAIAVQLVKELKALPGVRGVHLYAIEWPEAVARVVDAAGLLPRPDARVVA
jgi:methylenetetrahydrofolate reductase (NADPH)